MHASPLKSLVKSGVFTRVAELEVLAHVRDPLAEARSAASGAGLADRCHRARLRVTGADRVAFLQGQLTNDVKALRPGEGCYAAALTGKGKMRGELRVLARPDDLWLELEGTARAGLVAHLERFVIMEDVAFEDRSAELAQLGVYGPLGRKLLGQALGAELPELAEGHWTQLGGLTLMGDPATGLAGYSLIAPADELAATYRSLEALGAGPLGEDGFEALRIEAGIPRWGFELDEDCLPLEAHLTRAISYTKGCYTGQETVARIKTYGHVNRELVGLELEGSAPAARGTALRSAGKPVGAVTSSALAPGSGRPLALAMVRRELARAGVELELEAGPAPNRARVVRLPFGREGA